MRLPRPRGPRSAALLDALARPVEGRADRFGTVASGGWRVDDPLRDDDLQVFLYVCYELHLRGWDGVDERWEWHPGLLAARAEAEAVFEDAVRALVGPLPTVAPGDLPRALADLVAADDGPELAKYLDRRASAEEFAEFVACRSVYHLREADPHTFGIPRLAGRAKAALVEIQIDEYGSGQPERMHAELFRTTMRELRLDTRDGAYLDWVPAVTLASNNLMSLFGLHRRLRGALLGHLAAFEMTSSLPNRRYGNGLRRLGYGPVATTFFDEHVEADAVHEQIAAHDLCGAFAADEPDRVGEVLFGAAACLAVDRLVAGHLLDAWARRRQPAPAPVPV